MNPPRRPSLQGKSPPLPPPQPQETSQSDRSCSRYQTCIVFICRSLRKHIDQNDLSFAIEDLKQLDRSAVTVLRYLRKHIKETDYQLEGIRTELVQSQAECSHQRLLREELMREMEGRMADLRSEMGRREQEYRGLVRKMVGQLHQAQKVFEKEQRRMQDELTATNDALRVAVERKRGAGNMAGKLREVLGEIELRRQNSMISSKGGGQLSLQELGDMVGEGGTVEQQLQIRLSDMICLGLFQPSNQKYLRQMMEVTARLQHPSQLLEWGTYPIIAEMLIANMKKYNEKECELGQEGEREAGRVQLRNINNLSELSIGDSHCEQHNAMAQPPIFKRKAN